MLESSSAIARQGRTRLRTQSLEKRSPVRIVAAISSSVAHQAADTKSGRRIYSCDKRDSSREVYYPVRIEF